MSVSHRLAIIFACISIPTLVALSPAAQAPKPPKFLTPEVFKNNLWKLSWSGDPTWSWTVNDGIYVQNTGGVCPNKYYGFWVWDADNQIITSDEFNTEYGGNAIYLKTLTRWTFKLTPDDLYWKDGSYSGIGKCTRVTNSETGVNTASQVYTIESKIRISCPKKLKPNIEYFRVTIP